jgi:hypothetical protein
MAENTTLAPASGPGTVAVIATAAWPAALTYRVPEATPHVVLVRTFPAPPTASADGAAGATASDVAGELSALLAPSRALPPAPLFTARTV